MNYRELHCPFIDHSLDQLRYVLGYLAFQNSDEDFCILPPFNFPHVHARRKK
jgi:hypothetical protein